MQITVTGVQGSGFVECTISHKGQSITWSTRAYSKVKLQDPTRVFKEINDYLEYAGEDVQDKIWNEYKRIRDLFNMDFDPSHITATLIHYIQQIYSVLPMNNMRRWLLTVGNLHIPADIQKTITEDSRYNKREQTYLQHDYINLATVALALRVMIPIWGEYMDQGTDQDLYRENDVVGLISRCEVANWPAMETDTVGEPVDTAFDKLEGYVRFCVEDEPTTLGRLWSGMSSVEIPVHLQSKVLVRRLTIVPLNDPSSHSIVANVFRYVRSNLNPTERSTADRVNEKRPEGGSGDEDDKTSFIEAHKTKGRVSPGDIEAFNIDAMDYELLAETVDPTINKAMLKACINCIDYIANKEIRPHQVLLAQWVMAKAFPARAFYHIDKMPVNHLLATTQALLWHWGFLDVAIFMQVEPLYHGDHQSSNQLSQTRSGARIANRYKPMLDELYPHMKLAKVPQSGEIPKPDNMAGIAINSANASIRSSNWVFRGPPELFNAANQVAQNDVLMVPPNIKHALTEMVMHLAKINQ
ncbi:hypothetical protein AVT69_gp063 [Pseudomonas phage PhiPA3]|uniref:Uncharacterized protein 062 n=1 Tax=Pseudomonas phage PhiPA3 TaxID=998086 RepID=F8SJU4_BPPA3|nr:hypothetical protein AVT69_gp063 [Pseudomonas phage PhiPA3]AEH03489.1 hypothetical protein [Pseudomonas phage PhiPA3]